MELSKKDLYLIQLWGKYDMHDLKESLQEYHFLVDTLIYIHEAISEKKVHIKNWQKLSETLLYKFSFHGLTLHNILSGLLLHSKYYRKEMTGKTIIDISSAKVVLRAQLEAFLMYHYIYVNPETDDLKELRYYAWVYSSLIQRQELVAETEYAQQQKARDLIELEKIKSLTSNLQSFKNLSEKQQKQFFEKGSGKLFNHWSTILKETGFTEKNPMYTIYTFLCIYAHSEGLSAIQLEYSPNGLENIHNHAFLDLHHAKYLVCLMINSVSQLFEAAKNRYETLPDSTKWSIEFYARLAMHSTE